MSCGKDGSYLFTREQTSYLISLYEQNPILYEVKNDNYKNKSRRQIAFVKIQEDFNQKFLFTNVTVEDIKKKINNLRTQFFAEINKVSKSSVSGAGLEDIYKPTLWCFELLHFLKSGNPTRLSTSNLPQPSPNIEKEQEEDGELLFDGTVEELHSRELMSPLSSPNYRPSTSASLRSEDELPKKRKRTSKSEGKSLDKSNAIAIMEQASKLLELESTGNQKPVEPVNVIDAFLGTVGAEMREIKSKDRCRKLRKKIIDLIYEAQEEEAAEND